MSDTEIGVLIFVVGWIMFAAGYALAILKKNDEIIKIKLRMGDLDHRTFAAIQFLVRIKNVLRNAEKYRDGDAAVVEDIKRIIKNIPPAWAGVFQEK